MPLCSRAPSSALRRRIRAAAASLPLALGLVAAPAFTPAADAATAPRATTPRYAMPSIVAIMGSPSTPTHTCSGAVLHVPGASYVVTAAHCVTGAGTGMRVVPGYDRGRRPYGTWQVVAAYVDPGWQRSADPRRDLAILRLRQPGQSRSLTSLVGGYHLGHATTGAPTVDGYGYRAGLGDRVVGCRTAVGSTTGYPTLPCAGMWDGVSGSPLLTVGPDGRKVVRGVIGGLHEGGCSPDVSYASPLGAWSDVLLRRALSGARADVVRRPLGDGC